MRFPIVLTVISAIVGLALVLAIGTVLIRPPQDLILEAGFDSEIISPNADSENDISYFHYELSRNANVSIVFESENGQSYYFREQEPRSPQSYEVLFSGVVDGYLLEGESLALNVAEAPDAMVVERRLLPNGNYTWRMIAENDSEREEKSGSFVIENGDTGLPIITSFTISNTVFTPNRDGVNDRVVINIFLEKDANVRIFLLNADNIELPIPEREEWSCRPEDECGRYTFDYEGGVDLGQTPPPDGTYRIVVLAQDDEGQRIRRESSLSIQGGGVPRAEIAPQVRDADVFWISQPYEERFLSNELGFGDAIAQPEIPDAVGQNLITVPYGDMLVFRLTVNNYSDVPIRTTNPPSGTVYQQGQLTSSINALDEAGAWRVGIQCDTSLASFPYRWAVGTAEDLISISDEETGRDYTYLPARTSTVVWGAIRLTDINEFANPQTCWAGLIHEGVGISVENNNVSPIEVQIGNPPVESGGDGQ
jgi:hypothetical protein